MVETIELTDDFLNTCMGCGNRFDAKGIYDFYCSEECEKKDKDRITKSIEAGKHPAEIMNEAIKKGQ